jgi:hypothetical protein
MTMKRALVLAAVLAFLAGCAPVDAAHVNEPASPVTGLTVDVYNYQTGVRVACDGTQTVNWPSVRIEPHATFAGAPSEHWMATVEVFAAHPGSPIDVTTIKPWSRTPTDRPASAFQLAWDEQWRHQNAPPHVATGTMMEVTQSNHYFRGATGTYLVRVSVKGDVSGRDLVAACAFAREG